jgi:hypothetical protein
MVRCNLFNFGMDVQWHQIPAKNQTISPKVNLRCHSMLVGKVDKNP